MTHDPARRPIQFAIAVAADNDRLEIRFNPAASEMLAQGDRVLVAGESQRLKTLERALA